MWRTGLTLALAVGTLTAGHAQTLERNAIIEPPASAELALQAAKMVKARGHSCHTVGAIVAHAEHGMKGFGLLCDDGRNSYLFAYMGGELLFLTNPLDTRSGR